MQTNETWLELKAKTFKVFADPTRLRILEVLREGEFNVSAIMEKLGLKQSTVSQHLRMLKECGVVATRKEGREIYYSLKSDKVITILDEGDELLTQTIEELTSCVCP
jgi:ArsR family transcriptional regulator